MRIDGISLSEGSVISNLSVARGTSFPASPNQGELFYREDIFKLYVYDNVGWKIIAKQEDLDTASTAIAALQTPTYITQTPTTTLGNEQALSTLSTGIVHNTTGTGVLTSGPVNLPTEVSGILPETSIVDTGTPGTYTKVSTDAKGRVTAGSNPTTLAGYGIVDAAPLSHVSDDTVHITSGQNTFLDAVTVTSAEVNYLTGASSNIQTQISAKVAKAGDAMASAANLVFSGGGTVTGLPLPTTATQAASKAYVDSLAAGLSWQQPVINVGTSLPGTATTNDRFLNTTDNKIYTATATNTWDSGIIPVDGWALFDKSSETGYVYSGSVWVQFTGTGQITAGTGLAKTGNTLDINLGAGIAQLPTDEVGIDVYATGGLMTTVDGTISSTLTNAQLSLTKTGITAGTYKSVNVDVYGRITAGTNPTTLAGYGIVMTSSDVTTALGYTPSGSTVDPIAMAIALG